MTTFFLGLSAVATLIAACAAVYYVVLTHRLWEATKANVEMLRITRETDLMLRLMNGYDQLRPDIVALRRWAGDDVRSRAQVFRDEFADAAKAGRPYNIDDARHAVSRFFVTIRKLVDAKVLSEETVSKALDARSIDVVFLKLVDPLDEIAASDHYRRDDHEFFVSLLRRQYRY